MVMDGGNHLHTYYRQRINIPSVWQVPGWLSGKESACHFTILGKELRCEFDPWVGKISCKRKWQPPPVFLPGKSCGQRSLAGYGPWGHKRVRHDLVTKQQQNLICQMRKPRHREVKSLVEGFRSGPWMSWCYSNVAAESLPWRSLYYLACFLALPTQGFATVFWLVW